MDARLLMCPPGAAATLGAQREWDRLVELIRCAGPQPIEFLEPAAGFVDAASAALVSGKLAILGSTSDPVARRGSNAYRAWFTGNGFAVASLSQASFAGTSDALYDRRRPLLFVGHGIRSERNAAVQIAETIGTRTVPLRLIDQRLPSLDSVLCPLGSGHALVHMEALSADSQCTLRRVLEPEALIEVGREDALALACSALEIGDALVFHDASARLRRQLGAIGYRVFATDLGGFVTAGIGAKRLALRVDDGPTLATAA